MLCGDCAKSTHTSSILWLLQQQKEHVGSQEPMCCHCNSYIQRCEDWESGEKLWVVHQHVCLYSPIMAGAKERTKSYHPFDDNKVSAVMLQVSTRLLNANVLDYSIFCFFAAFSSCCAEVALVAKQSPQTTSFHHTVTSAQPLSLYHSSPHRGTTVQSNSTASMSHTTTAQRTGQHQVTAAPALYVTAQAGAATRRAAGQTSPMVLTTTAANATAAGQATTQAMETITRAVKNTTVYSVAPANQTTTHASTATNTTMKNTTSEKQMTTTTRTATAKKIINPTTTSTNQTTTPKSPTATAMTNMTTVHPRTQTTISSSTVTVRPTLAPQPSPIPTGTYTLSSGNKTCIKAAMGLQLMVQNKQKVR